MSLRIAYQDGEDEWASLQPDFIIVSRRSDGSFGASIVDPHGDHLADARAKVRALADFAERYGDRFLHVDSIAKVGVGSLRVLDLTQPSVRTEVREFEGGRITGLYESPAAPTFEPGNRLTHQDRRWTTGPIGDPTSSVPGSC